MLEVKTRTVVVLLVCVVIAAVAGNSCDTNSPASDEMWFGYRDEMWYHLTKAAILKQADKRADSLTYSMSDDSSSVTYCYFSSGKKFEERRYYAGAKGNEFEGRRLYNGKRVAIFFSDDGEFELRREICRRGRFGFEGIFYQGAAYGLSTWRDCNTNEISSRGIRYNGKEVGIWLEQWEGIQGQVDKGNNDVLKSMPIISTL